MSKTLRILAVEDSEDDLLLLVRHLKQSGIDPVTRRVETVDALRDALGASHWDVILCDMSMPQFNAIGALAEVKSAGFDIPFIIVSGSVPEEQLVALMKAGAHDVIVKDRLSRLVAAIEREIEDAAVRRQRKRMEEERARLENALRHAQKMESLGTLSGGIAHEFNNMLLPISGLLELSLGELDDRPDVRENLEKALENSRRAAALVDKILTFSRIDNCALARTNVASAIDEAVALLRATIPATVQIEKALDDIGEAFIDKAQISQIVMNLGVNAMHAIDSGIGRIEFRLTTETVRRRRMTAGGQLSPGKYARLSVKDTGCGMDEPTIARIFEPFFTTKQVGKGTGMGLAFVHGVVKNHGGAIDVQSRPGAGTTFDVFVPFERAARSAAREPVPPEAPPLPMPN